MTYPYSKTCDKPKFRLSIWEQWLQLFFPNLCIYCKKSLFKHESHICLACWKKIPFAGSIAGLDEYVFKAYHQAHYLKHLSFLFYYTKKGIPKHILHQIKYKSNPDLALMLGRLMGEKIKTTAISDQFDVLLPVPIHPKKKIVRGYNQAELIALGIGEILQKPLLPENTILKTHYSSSQTKKDRIHRHQNTNHAFTLKHPEYITKKRILIVDDVLTTGATFEALVREIMPAQPKEINLSVLAYTRS